MALARVITGLVGLSAKNGLCTGIPISTGLPEASAPFRAAIPPAPWLSPLNRYEAADSLCRAAFAFCAVVGGLVTALFIFVGITGLEGE